MKYLFYFTLVSCVWFVIAHSATTACNHTACKQTKHNTTTHNATKHNATKHNATKHNATKHNATAFLAGLPPVHKPLKNASQYSQHKEELGHGQHRRRFQALAVPYPRHSTRHHHARQMHSLTKHRLHRVRSSSKHHASKTHSSPKHHASTTHSLSKHHKHSQKHQLHRQQQQRLYDTQRRRRMLLQALEPNSSSDNSPNDVSDYAAYHAVLLAGEFAEENDEVASDTQNLLPGAGYLDYDTDYPSDRDGTSIIESDWDMANYPYAYDPNASDVIDADWGVADYPFDLSASNAEEEMVDYTQLPPVLSSPGAAPPVVNVFVMSSSSWQEEEDKKEDSSNYGKNSTGYEQGLVVLVNDALADIAKYFARLNNLFTT